MFKKKIIFPLLFIFLFTACSKNDWDSVKRGLTGQKGNNTDEFLVRKKDPLVLPPDFENLPTPEEKTQSEIIEDEQSIFEKKLKKATTEVSTAEASNTEESILKKIQQK